MSDALVGEVQTIIFHNEDNGYVIARVKAKGEPGLSTIVGNLGALTPGETLEMTGAWVEHPKYGRQFSVERFEQRAPATVNGVVKFLSTSIKGVGEVTARRMVDEFGVEVLDVLEKEPDRLLAVKGVTKTKLDDMVESWRKQREVKNLIVFLHSHDIPPTFAARIFTLWADDSVARIQANPYELAYEVRGVGFRKADDMALKLGFAPDAPPRVEAAVLFALHTASERCGHLYLPRDELVEQTLHLTGPLDPSLVDEAVGALELKKRVRVEDSPDGGQAVYLALFYNMEQVTARRFIELLIHPNPISTAKILEALPKVEEQLGFRLSAEQREAVQAALAHKVFIITGGPGTGKTTITRAVAACLRKLKLKVKLAAPTGRAAKRLSEATGRPASTLHRMLQYSPEYGFGLNEENKLKADALVVDESSMLDAQLCVAMLKALPLTCRLILVGDVSQLPSVGPGNVLADAINSGAIPVARLTHIFRQALQSRIVINAHRFNEGKMPVQSDQEPPEADFFWIAQDNPAKVRALIQEMVCERIPERYRMDPVRDVQVLTPMHKGEAGTISLNAMLQQALNPLSGSAVKNGRTLFKPGDKVLMLRNNYDKEVFNGDLGRVLETDPSEGSLLVDFDGNAVVMDPPDLDDLSLAYAISVHKSQGSEYPAVVLPVLTQHYVLLQRNLLYTALTRARKLAVIVGGVKALRIGLANVTAGARRTGLARKLAAMIEENRLPLHD
ncbi:MAG: exodeoxyribonuclease alpha subunit [Desulfovibrionales bacterium]|nr:exodeoxyribonuclease alpha subunit [Desulfovibrionales bacterium]